MAFLVEFQEEVIARLWLFFEGDVADSVGDFTAGYPTVFALVEMFGVGRGIDLYITGGLGPHLPFDNVARVIDTLAYCFYINELRRARGEGKNEYPKTFREVFRHM